MFSGEAKKTPATRTSVAAKLIKSAVPIFRSKSRPIGAGLVCVGMRVGKYREGLCIWDLRRWRTWRLLLPDRSPKCAVVHTRSTAGLFFSAHTDTLLEQELLEQDMCHTERERQQSWRFISYAARFSKTMTVGCSTVNLARAFAPE